ncbi:uncharacterized protein GGS22DRAFT_148152 [Annulohypoxylon maeteangense]|uniref:uncharacterized protein n=1 Tax=Annulohypoxylon maeteangense TaxID=1927788 RepID=UPI002008ABDC|nr:uncharacterized protein GGS22DRAFT_148152 [Annulohypoxylon maeteangense]KAI0884918.1 hypothetical protein GGS22DRAFT_148152 [Annulohypoxylon maeteangense]
MRRLRESIKRLRAKLFKTPNPRNTIHVPVASNDSSAASTDNEEDVSDETSEEALSLPDSTNYSASTEGTTSADEEVESAPSLPAPSSQFISYLNQSKENKRTPTRDLVKPYLLYENRPRYEFLRPNATIDALANLVPIYDGQESLFKIRTIDYEKADKDLYLMRLRGRQREKKPRLAIAKSFEAYQKNFDAFTHGVLAGLDWSNVVVAGSSAMLPLLSRRRDVHIEDEPTTQNPGEIYYQNTASSSDIDIFLYGFDSEDAATKRIIEIEALVRKNQHLISSNALTLRSENAITFIAPRWPYRHIQVILRLYKSISEILTGFDVDCSCVAFDGKQVYSSPRGVTAIATRTNTIDLSRRSPSYENRLWKYRHHNFEVYWEALDRSRITIDFHEDDVFSIYEGHTELTGLARLLLSEAVLKKMSRPRGYNHWRMKANLKKLDDGGDPNMVAETSSGYANHRIPYGLLLTAESVRGTVIEHAKTPYMFGTIQEVTDPKNPKCKWELKHKSKTKLRRKVTFIKFNPGRQMIGSFYPLTDDDWTRMAYEP